MDVAIHIHEDVHLQGVDPFFCWFELRTRCFWGENGWGPFFLALHVIFLGNTHVGSVDSGENVRMCADYVDWKSHPFQKGKSLLKDANPTKKNISFASSQLWCMFRWNFQPLEDFIGLR